MTTSPLIIEELVKISTYAGKHPQWVQGAGGNCSVKEGALLHVKSSGIFLEEVSTAKGHAAVSLQTGLTVEGQKERPSLETPLHLHLGRFVIHTHPIGLNIYLCAQEGQEILSKKFKDMAWIWIEYATPGKKLFEKVKTKLASADRSKPLALFLENHGLFVSAPTAAEAMTLHEEIVQKTALTDLRAVAEFQTPQKYLTPDHVVFFNLKEVSGKNKQALAELSLSHQLISENIKKLNLTPKYLSAENVAELLNMEEEKYRQKINS